MASNTRATDGGRVRPQPDPIAETDVASMGLFLGLATWLIL